MQKYLLDTNIILDISSRDTALLDAYATIHNYSKNLLPDKPLGHSLGIQNNDVWISATAMVANAILVTTDSDFDHLNRAFLTVLKFTAQ